MSDEIKTGERAINVSAAMAELEAQIAELDEKLKKLIHGDYDQ